MNSVELGAFMAGLKQTVSTASEADCLEPMSGVVRQIEGFRSEGRFGDLVTSIDEPVVFGGTGTAPNPAEVALAGLGASVEVTLLCYAAYLGIDVGQIEVKVSGALDARGFFGLSDSVPVGFYDVTLDVSFSGSATPEEIARLHDHVDRCCPVLAVFRQPMDVRLNMGLRA